MTQNLQIQGEPMTKRLFEDGEEFYNRMHTYRHMPIIKFDETQKAYEDVKDFIDSSIRKAEVVAVREYMFKVRLKIEGELHKILSDELALLEAEVKE